MLNLEFICDLKSKTVAYGAKEKECDFPVTSITRIEVANLFDLNTMHAEEKARVVKFYHFQIKIA